MANLKGVTSGRVVDGCCGTVFYPAPGGTTVLASRISSSCATVVRVVLWAFIYCTSLKESAKACMREPLRWGRRRRQRLDYEELRHGYREAATSA